ncbi:succinate dehydrogenase assembly factor 4, mitochondrial-like [Macrosteles quadrilineatus]|uniref:succinate dehydrogenase assembly factor 4, mitochondrial-like n=1 Tax=Macrosteles quadrilineatus TaxID=74068 RepID=UPI0023E32D13|nr:succinate dehydrogenase assembly factor 4, mitochondrial-like [Macrosteles quadrilineatus]
MNCVSMLNISQRLSCLYKRNTINTLKKFSSTSSTKPESGNEGSSCEKTEQISKKLRAKTPIGKLDELDVGKHPFQEKEPLPEWPDNTNPHTGEIGGPRGPEPTRYGDWERKGRVTDF